MNSQTNTENINISDTYQMKTDKQHILERPDTYTGSIECDEKNMWIIDTNVDTNSDKIILKNINYVPALYKIFDEAIVNCRDHYVRIQEKMNEQKDDTDTNNLNSENLMYPVTNIDVSISQDGIITMCNNGNGIDVVKHPDNDLWVPEMIFAHLRTSTNYSKNKKKTTGGKNGYGVKLVFIWSTYGCIETIDHTRGLKYFQEFENNLDIIHPPKITKCSQKPYTKIIFKPDYEKYGINGLTPDIINLFKRRIYDISAVTDRSVKVKYNGNIIPIKNFEQYINMYIGDKTECKRIYESNENGRWEYAVAVTPMNEFKHISFVNGIFTSKGGKHVDYIINQITKKLCDLIEKKKKVRVNSNTIKEQIILFLRCDIEEPSFDSQTKDFMDNPPIAKFGSKCDVSDKFIEKVATLGIMETACDMTKIKENKNAKKLDGSKTRKIAGIPKLSDANWAGTIKSKHCILIITEGDSAKSGVMSGLTESHRNYIGVYPSKGKYLNVRGETSNTILKNEEIDEIKKILGLEFKKEYKNIDDVHKNLRYSKVVFMTDQDFDGSHIKGLGINLFQSQWSSLFRIPGFLSFMNTPILKAKKGNVELSFYNNGEYEEWKKNNLESLNSWKIKYYKGLGTSVKQEWVEYLKNPKFVDFIYEPEISDDVIDMAFNGKRVDDRKYWLKNIYDRNSYLNTSDNSITYTDFINKEFIHFSKYDCDRSIPNLMDGLKISTRKIMYCAFKKNLNSEIKVAQFSGYVSEHSCYHHGEDSLNKAIIGLAQNFVGSNNINLLTPAGQFGTRLLGGKDSSSPRYIFTKLEKITKLIFQEKDKNILNYLDDDGISVEPQFYVPIIPMILVNGSSGIGTGFSTDVMCYNVIDIINYLKNKLISNNELNNGFEFIPYYEGFKGQIIKISQTKFMFKGIYEKIAEDQIRIIELPIGMWTDKFEELLDKLECDKDKNDKKIIPMIKEHESYNTDDIVNFTIKFMPGKLQELEETIVENGCNGLEKLLKLYTTNTITNMNLFDENDKLIKYNTVNEIIDGYYNVRLEYYNKRKNNLIQILERELKVLSNKARFISGSIVGDIDLRNKSEKQVSEMLKDLNFDIIDDDEKYLYLVDMKMRSVCIENVNTLNREFLNKQNEMNEIKNTTIQQMWLNDLNILENEYKENYYKNNSIQTTLSTINNINLTNSIKTKKNNNLKTEKTKTTKTTKIKKICNVENEETKENEKNLKKKKIIKTYDDDDNDDINNINNNDDANNNINNDFNIINNNTSKCIKKNIKKCINVENNSIKTNKKIKIINNNNNLNTNDEITEDSYLSESDDEFEFEINN